MKLILITFIITYSNCFMYCRLKKNSIAAVEIFWRSRSATKLKCKKIFLCDNKIDVVLKASARKLNKAKFKTKKFKKFSNIQYCRVL